MGGLFSSAPTPPPPEPEPIIDTEAEERARRLENIERRRRGRTGTVATSWRGLEASDQAPDRNKEHLGD